MRAILTTLLDALALLLIAAGLAALTYRWIGLGCLTVAGVVILLGSALAVRPARPKRGDAK
jgi:hypothetical protein